MFPWTDEQIEQLRAGRAEGKSATVIAAELSSGADSVLSRSSVIGKWNRLGLSVTSFELRKKRAELRAKRMADGWIPEGEKKKLRRPPLPGKPGKLLAIPKIRRTQSRKQFVMETGWGVRDLPVETPATAVAFLDLRSRQCRWPVSGELADMVCCGGHTRRGLHYCDAHMRRAYARTESVKQTVRRMSQFALRAA